MTDLYIISIIIATVAVTAVITSLLTSRKMRRKVAYMLDALEDKELNFRFDEKRIIGRRFNSTLNRLRGIFDKERREINEQEKYFGLMLDHVKTGIVVIEEKGQVSYCNNTALALLGIATLGHIRQLRTISESLYEIFQLTDLQNTEYTIQMVFKQERPVSFARLSRSFQGQRPVILHLRS